VKKTETHAAILVKVVERKKLDGNWLYKVMDEEGNIVRSKSGDEYVPETEIANNV